MSRKQNKNKLVFETVTFTPQAAKTELESNGFEFSEDGSPLSRRSIKNRTITMARVLSYAEEMKAGQWHLNGQPIIYDENDMLRNGQHRLLACVLSGVSFTTAVVRGVDKLAFQSMDQGLSRSAAHVLDIEGKRYATRKASGARMYKQLKKCVDEGTRYYDWHKRMSTQDILAFVEENDQKLEEACIAIRLEDGKHLLRPPSIWIAVYLLLRNVNKRRCEEFFRLLVTGDSLEKDHPIAKFRSLLLNDISRVNYKRSNASTAALAIKTWNRYLTGDSRRSLSFREGVEDFPRIERRKTANSYALV